MYLKDTPQFNLLERMYWIEKAAAFDAPARTLGLAHTKVEPDISVVNQLAVDGYLAKITRENWIAIWITTKGVVDFKAHLDSIPVPLPLPDPEKDRMLALKAKLVAGTITSLEKVEFIDLVLKRITL